MSTRGTVCATALISLLLTAAPRLFAQELVLGQVLPLTGPMASVGQDIRRGSEVCVEWVNRRGGIAGRRLKLVTRDDAGDPARTLREAKSLVAEAGASLLLGPVGAPATMALLPWATRERIAVLEPHTGEQRARQREWDAGLFLTANHSAEAQRLADHLDTLGVKSAVIIHESEGPGSGALIALQEALAIVGIQTVGVSAVREGGANAMAAVRSALGISAQALVLGTSGPSTVAVLKALGSIPGRHWLYGRFGLSFAATPAELRAIGAVPRGLALTQVLPDPTDPRQRLADDYRSALREAREGTASPAGMAGCVGPLVLAEALRGRGVPTRERLLQALRDVGSVRLGDISFPLNDPSMRGSRFIDIVTVDQDGRLRR